MLNGDMQRQFAGSNFQLGSVFVCVCVRVCVVEKAVKRRGQPHSIPLFWPITLCIGGLFSLSAL